MYIHIHMHTYIYIYIYMCVCVCIYMIQIRVQGGWARRWRRVRQHHAHLRRWCPIFKRSSSSTVDRASQRKTRDSSRRKGGKESEQMRRFIRKYSIDDRRKQHISQHMCALVRKKRRECLLLLRAFSCAPTHPPVSSRTSALSLLFTSRFSHSLDRLLLAPAVPARSLL